MPNERDLKSVKELRRGDIIRGKLSGDSYVVTDTMEDCAIAVRSIEVTNPPEWVVIEQPPVKLLHWIEQVGEVLTVCGRPLYLRDSVDEYVDNMREVTCPDCIRWLERALPGSTWPIVDIRRR